jgi:hypothetical protein
MRGLSHLPVASGKEAEYLNRELTPCVRDLAAQVAALEDRMDELVRSVRSIAIALGLPAAQVDAYLHDI